MIDELSKDPITLTQDELATCLDLLYINLKKLAMSADFSIACNQMSAATKKQLKQIIKGKERSDEENLRGKHKDHSDILGLMDEIKP